jgi:hypothetical protein
MQAESHLFFFQKTLKPSDEYFSYFRLLQITFDISDLTNV